MVVAESGVSDASTLVRWRALGFDAALIGEALMRAPDPRGRDRSVRRCRAACRATWPPPIAQPEVKICGIVDEDGVLRGERGAVPTTSG